MEGITFLKGNLKQVIYSKSIDHLKAKQTQLLLVFLRVTGTFKLGANYILTKGSYLFSIISQCD